MIALHGFIKFKNAPTAAGRLFKGQPKIHFYIRAAPLLPRAPAAKTKDIAKDIAEILDINPLPLTKAAKTLKTGKTPKGVRSAGAFKSGRSEAVVP